MGRAPSPPRSPSPEERGKKVESGGHPQTPGEAAALHLPTLWAWLSPLCSRSREGKNGSGGHLPKSPAGLHPCTSLSGRRLPARASDGNLRVAPRPMAGLRPCTYRGYGHDSVPLSPCWRGKGKAGIGRTLPNPPARGPAAANAWGTAVSFVLPRQRREKRFGRCPPEPSGGAAPLHLSMLEARLSPLCFRGREGNSGIGRYPSRTAENPEPFGRAGSPEPSGVLPWKDCTPKDSPSGDFPFVVYSGLQYNPR